MQFRIALLEDEKDQAELVKSWLQEYGYFCHHFDRSAKLLKTVVGDSFDLFILDWELPDINGDIVVERLRNEYDLTAPILFTTNRESEADIVRGLESGADDYLIKPLRKHEFKARLNALLRRVASREEKSATQDFAPYVFNKESDTVTFKGQTVQLTSKEFQLALFIFSNAGKVLSRGHILERIWGQRSDLNTRTVDTHISTVRQKLKIRPDMGWKLSSIYRHGYRLEKLSSEDSNAS